MPARYFRVFTAIAGTCLLLAPGASVAASLSKTPANAHVLPVRLTGADVPELRGADPVGLTVLTCHDGRPTPIPFQVDEFDKRGRLVAAGGITNRKQDESPRKIDENDELVVMMRDIGEACAADQLERVPGRIVEVELNAGHFKQSGRLYLTVSERGHIPSTRYVQYDSNRDLIKSSAYEWGYNDKLPHLFDYLTAADYQRPDVDLMDRLKVRMNARSLGKLISISVDENEIESSLDVVKAGPIRVIRDLSLKVTPVPGMTIEAFVLFTHYDRFWDAVVHFKMPGPAAMFTSSLDVTFYQDYTNLLGVQFSTAALPKGVLIDGRMLEMEKSMAFGDKPWLMLNGRGLRLLTIIQYDRKLSLAGRVQFVDDPEHESPPESRKGALPLVGFELTNWENLKARWYSFSAQEAFLKGFPEGGGNGFYETMRREPTLKSRVFKDAIN